MTPRPTTELALVYRVLGAKGSVTRPIKQGIDKKTISVNEHTRQFAYQKRAASSKQFQGLQKLFLTGWKK